LGVAQKKDISQLRRVEALLQPPMDSRVSIDLARWREAVGATVFRERTIGLVGHSAISVDQTRQIAAMIPRLVESLRAEERLGPSGDEFWTLVTPLAPGVDFVLPRLLCRALGAMPELNQPRRRRYRLLVVRGLSPRRLAQAYLARVTDQSDATPDGVRTVVHQDFTGRRPLDSIAAIEKLLGDFARLEQVCERVIDLSPAHDPADRDAMHAGLSAANRYLLERCDDLVAVIDPARYGEKRPLDVDRWRGVDSNALPAHGTGALVSAWLRRPSRRHAAVGPLSPSGLHPIEIQ
jgi:hypothetical protein